MRISATEVTGEGGYMKSAVLVEGCRSMDGYTPSALENGTYLLQAPSYRYDAEREKYFLGKYAFKTKPTQPNQIPKDERYRSR